ncbi:MAG: bifunctional 5,10-methylenetetrahydrofolate dehydrogenase/5,10-methenyltetrahydrofolate cyclohydrolase [Deltaproteobacteria bacterium]|jgi:methylenetetrahydrofolate dehydrogenase (NADP+)/methenyltetrahydrofolate cyclohydrolase|nr:bifunctional 5,10-methylenetetrahydrofolate dehydrogenase/5,10-methenyltetrahydrofolate cyclohydrolase [Deltaproteobacteria bacterium]
MTATMLASKPIVQKFKEGIQKDVEDLKLKGTEPMLATVIAGWDGPSKAYALSKEKTCHALGINFSLNVYDHNVTEDRLLDAIATLNEDGSVHGIMLELPLPKHIDSYRVTSAIRPNKDVDGITPENRGLLLMGKLDKALLPVTPLSCLTLIESSEVDVAGKNVAIIGRGETVGLPLTVLLIKRSATVTVCHSRTKDLDDIVRHSDIVVAATGQAGLVKKSMLSAGQVVIDAGISVLPDGKITGDVENGASEVVSYLTPVPGGVGSLTVMLLLRNLFKAIGLQNGRARI